MTRFAAIITLFFCFGTGAFAQTQKSSLGNELNSVDAKIETLAQQQTEQLHKLVTLDEVQKKKVQELHVSLARRMEFLKEQEQEKNQQLLADFTNYKEMEYEKILSSSQLKIYKQSLNR